ncbi:MAG: hypothetical protein FJ117_05240 [Deltaproteobacteria bacterium]|nr:hypothetical protein [Deltaproteobacteria bacterium]
MYFKDELVIKQGKRPDFTLFLNGLPIITMEVKHEKNQTLHDAVKQYVERDHSDMMFQLPFLHSSASPLIPIRRPRRWRKIIVARSIIS